MSKKKTSKIIEDFVNEHILTENLDDLVGERFGRYSRYIIQERALPDARDGLKPVQRRILYAMYKLGMFSNKPFKKSARIVGEVIGKFHPHGDTSVYDAMVRMSQDFKSRLPLIEMHGNNGSMDGDPPAAMRYTEARLSKNAEYLLLDINKKTVGFVPNFDDEEYEPTVLPARYPNLLVNGATGISAGYATDIPPHNINEIIKATIYCIDHPECSVEDLMKIVKGPDFPTGGIIQGLEGIKDAYRTGRGKISIVSKTEVVEEKNLYKLVITEIPYETNKAVLVKKMSDIVTQKNVDGVIDIRDESDRDGLRIVVDIKKDANPEYIRNFLLKSSGLQTNYNFNMVCIVNKRPELLGLKELLESYIAHQKEVITNRSNFELKSALKRQHIVEGLIEMTSILDAVIATIRASQNKKDAKENLISNYNFSELQAEAIVMLQLYRLTNTDIMELKAEQEKLSEKIKLLEALLSDEMILYKVIKDELHDALKDLASPRKTVVEEEVEDFSVEVQEIIAKEDVMVIVTHDSYIKRLSMRSYAALPEEGTTKLKEDDFIIAELKMTTVDTLLLFTNQGNYVYLPVHKIPDVKHKDLGYNVSTLINMETGEDIIFVAPVDDFEKERYLLMTTQNGLIKRTPLKDMVATRFSKSLRATKIRKGDALVSVDISKSYHKELEVAVITKEGFMNRYDAEEISIMAPPSFGVKAMELKSRPKDKVVAAFFVEPKDIITILTDNGNIKRYKTDDIIKGKKNHVGKPHISLPKSFKSEIISADIVHDVKQNHEVDGYILGEKGFDKIDMQTIRAATAASGKKLSLDALGKLNRIVFKRNSEDYE